MVSRRLGAAPRERQWARADDERLHVAGLVDGGDLWRHDCLFQLPPAPRVGGRQHGAGGGGGGIQGCPDFGGERLVELRQLDRRLDVLLLLADDHFICILSKARPLLQPRRADALARAPPPRMQALRLLAHLPPPSSFFAAPPPP